nr:MAG TPA: Helicase ATPase REPLICATION [Bacteriophage sp.]
MSLRSRVLGNLKRRKEKLLNGGINSIPSPFIRFSDDFIGVEQGKYYVVTSTTKGAKTQFASFVFVFQTILYAYYHPEQLRIKIFYYPLEETPDDIMTRFMSFLLYNLSGGKIRIAPIDLLSTKNDRPVDDSILELLNTGEYAQIIDFFEEHVIFSVSTNPTGVFIECKEYAEGHGKVYTKKQKIKDEFTGETREIDAFDHYEQDDPDEYRIIFFDHVSLTSTEKGIITLKQGIDKLSEKLVKLRNRYRYTPVVIQQQAFAGESLDAFKENKLRPTIANLADSKYPSRDANVVLGLFSPFKYELPEYQRYDITKLKDNVRFLEVLVNRGGSPGGLVALYFDGAVNYFNELPRPEEREALKQIYDFLVESRKRKPIRAFIAFIKRIFT